MLCTKLVQWLTLSTVFFSVWSVLVAEVLPLELSAELYRVILAVECN